MKATEEQTVNSAIVTAGDDLIINAGAGCGKSSNLRIIGHNNPDKNFLTICFTAANAEESRNHIDRPSNMYYSTIHAIAYHTIIGCDKDMKKKLNNYLNYKDITDSSLINAGLTKQTGTYGTQREITTQLRKGMQDAIVAYCRSDSKDLLQFATNKFRAWFGQNLITVRDEDVGDMKKKAPIVLSEDEQDTLASLTRKYWLDLIQNTNDMYITPDVYLKLYQLRGFRITEFYDKDTRSTVQLDVLALDEMQDTNPVSVAIFNNSPLQKLGVGDDMQQLYAWRGAGDAMQLYPHFKQGVLTESFRFNQHIADMANLVLANANSPLFLRGSGKRTKIETYAHLCYTNASVLRHIFEASEINPNVRIATNADFKSLFSKLYHVNALQFDKVPQYPCKELKDIMTKADLLEACELSPEMLALTRMAKSLAKANGGLHAGIQKLQEHIIAPSASAVYTVNTIHKSKGLEYDYVSIDEDFLKVQLPKKEESFDFDEDTSYSDEELVRLYMQAVEEMWDDRAKVCMLYVAITRAKVSVELPWYLVDTFSRLQAAPETSTVLSRYKGASNSVASMEPMFDEDGTPIF